MDQNLRISLVQTDIYWEDKNRNLLAIENKIAHLSDKTDLVVLPEMFTTGFSMDSKQFGEPIAGETVTTLKRWATQYGFAIVGSFIAEENNQYYNRGFFISSEQEFFYDKRHLFRMGNESACFTAGSDRLIVEHKGFKVCLLICYDLRFPVWSRNVNNEYDLLIYVANWPQSRSQIWDTLLKARAIENMSYVCGVNRVGVDGLNLLYKGGSVLIDAKGNALASVEDNKEGIETIEISLEDLNRFRDKFPAWMDGDKFELRD